MRQPLLTLAAALATVALTSAALAQQTLSPTLNFNDADHDEFITTEEFRAALPAIFSDIGAEDLALEQFLTLDISGDGKVSLAELATTLPKDHAGVRMKVTMPFTEADKDHDGRVTADELKPMRDLTPAAFLSLIDEALATADANHDGVWIAAEWEALRGPT